MPFAVRLSKDAVRDLEDICETVVEVDGRSRAQYVLIADGRRDTRTMLLRRLLRADASGP